MTKMKKIVALGLAGILAVGFAACSNTATDEETTAGDSTAVVEAGEAKVGYGVKATVGHISHNEDEFKCEIDTIVAAVMVDADGKVIDCQIDEAQTQPNLQENDGFVADDALRTKKEKQEDYNMRAASPIEAEWFEQIAAFEDWTIGKTADEIANAEMTEGMAVADLASSCTIYSGGFQAVVVDAIKNATVAVSATDTLKLVLNTEKFYESVPGELVQYDTDIAVVTTDADGKITACLVDVTQGKCYVNGDKFVGAKDATDYINVEIKSKKQLGEDYAMRSASPIGAEWFEQAAAFEAWTIGKTADEVKAGLGEDMKVADLASSCTITATAMVETVAEAATK